MAVLRHKESYVIVTDLDPIEDILNIITALKSTGFTSDLLRETPARADVHVRATNKKDKRNY